ncbi:dipeptide/oligopeptide/nickel ABC transporter ATP-binding protein [Candidatus Marsarchaeota G1 archaeon BE_D]|uniref:Dipeptide/oligopeptide/nickel ABC transporter ATP-binding protein n=1 Tax=Candidatus Marsarchaeota G1 archaeon BE_D TaxID=1978156 RepID=A0A2R6ADV8_9ARCH|nr:MAG: dipeptide/oligopeptide/nickel ABC transporter ATP-binding protein [Candidatus Marsarchaeota G1 archaeon BE_D]
MVLVPILKAEGLSVDYFTQRGRLHAVSDVSFSLEEGESLGIVGESGSGKTTLATALLKLLPMNAEVVSGRVEIQGMDVLSMDEESLNKSLRWRVVSYVPQASQNALDPLYRIDDQFVETVHAHVDMPREEILHKAMELLLRVGVEPSKLRSYPWELSGGQKQRVMIALSLILKPKIVILDEPTTALDTIIQAQILELFRELKEYERLTAIFISHDISVISNVANRVGVMYAGRLVELGSSESVFYTPLHPYTQGLLKSVPDLRSDTPYSYIPGSPPDLVSPPSGCPFHPRCPLAMEICKKINPALEAYDGEHLVACHAVKR